MAARGSMVAPWVLWLILVVHPVARVLANMEGDALHSLQTNLKDPNNVLQSWDPTLVNPCTWFHVTCNSDNSVVRVDLGNANLSGQLVSQLGLLKNLQYLELYSNNIGGTIPTDLGNLTNLVSLDLYLNNFTGGIPESLGNLSKLRFLRLNNNSLTGPIPKSLTSINALQVLDLSNNNLSGEVPSTGSFSLFTPISFANNPQLCGPGTTKPCPGAPPFSPPLLLIHQHHFHPKELSDLTAIKANDILTTLQSLYLIRYKKGSHAICADPKVLDRHLKAAGRGGTLAFVCNSSNLFNSFVYG